MQSMIRLIAFRGKWPGQHGEITGAGLTALRQISIKEARKDFLGGGNACIRRGRGRTP